MRHTLAASLLALLLAGCGEPVFVPEAGPNAPGYTTAELPAPPDVELVDPASTDGKTGQLTPGGAIDRVADNEGSFSITGWAILAADEPRGVVRVVLPRGVDAEVVKVVPAPRADVVAAMDDEDLLWSGFTITLQGTLPPKTKICVLSKSRKGEFRLGGSDETLCPT